MTIASDLLQRHLQTLVADNGQWQTLIADDLVWELPYAPSIGHPARLAGREEVVGFVTWFLEAVEISASSICGCMPAPMRTRPSPKSRRRRVSSRRGGSIARNMWSSCGRQAARSHSYANISIPCGRPRRWTHPFWASNPEGKFDARGLYCARLHSVSLRSFAHSFRVSRNATVTISSNRSQISVTGACCCWRILTSPTRLCARSFPYAAAACFHKMRRMVSASAISMCACCQSFWSIFNNPMLLSVVATYGR